MLGQLPHVWSEELFTMGGKRKKKKANMLQKIYTRTLEEEIFLSLRSAAISSGFCCSEITPSLWPEGPDLIGALLQSLSTFYDWFPSRRPKLLTFSCLLFFVKTPYFIF